MIARGFLSLLTAHFPAPPRKCPNPSHSRTYGQSPDKSNDSRTYGKYRREGSNYVAICLPPIHLPVLRSCDFPAKSFLSPTSTRPVRKSFVSPTYAKTGGCPHSQNVGAPTFAIFHQQFRTFSRVPGSQRLRRPRFTEHEPQNTGHGSQATALFSHFASPFPPRGLQCARTFPTRGN
jgi:hypothetical protein